MAYAAPKIEQAVPQAESPAAPDQAQQPDRVRDDALPHPADFHPDFDDGHADADRPERDAVATGATDASAAHASPTDATLTDVSDAVVRAVGSLVCSWGSLERTTMDKLTAMRLAAGDVRLVGGRMRPGMARLLAELRALVSMRDRHDKQALVVIAELENHIQRIAQFHLLVISGFQASEADILLCRDSKNSERRISLGDVQREIAMIETIKERLSAI